MAIDAAARTAGHPTTIAVAGGAKDAKDLAAKLGLSEAKAALLEERVAAHGVKIVAGAPAADGASKATKAAPKKKAATKKKAAAKKK